MLDARYHSSLFHSLGFIRAKSWRKTVLHCRRPENIAFAQMTCYCSCRAPKVAGPSTAIVRT